MANRVTATEVTDIMDTDLTDSVIEVYIKYANALVNEHLDNSDNNLSDDVLKEIERYLSAHAAVATQERQAIEQEAGPVREKFADVFGMGFSSTTYGQMALNLDDTGTLDDLNQTKKKVVMKSVNEEHDFRYGFNADETVRG